jgi:DNA-binding NarL/FixJ family response regulator
MSIQKPTNLLDQLSTREREIAQCVAAGFGNRAIAALLGTSPNTVRNQIGNVFRKLGMKSRAELARALRRFTG